MSRRIAYYFKDKVKTSLSAGKIGSEDNVTLVSVSFRVSSIDFSTRSGLYFPVYYQLYFHMTIS